MNILDIINKQPIINIGMIGHVSNGKTKITACLSGIDTKKFLSEKEKNITINLGYANVKIWKCSSCLNNNFSSSGSKIMNKKCQNCNNNLNLVNHISIIDCPGHNKLTEIMISGTSIMNYTILVESYLNNNIPEKQTKEHFFISNINNIPICMVLMNKIDMINKEDAKKKTLEIKEFINNYSKNTIPIIPISAILNYNINYICEYLSQLKTKIVDNDIFQMIIIRSFDINKPNINVINLNGGVIGGSIISGKLYIGDNIIIYPNFYEKDSSGKLKYNKINAKVLSIQSEENLLDTAIRGGLLGIQLNIDPFITKQNKLVGSYIIKEGMENIISIFNNIIVEIIYYFDSKFKNKIDSLNKLKISINSNTTESKVLNYDKKKNIIKLDLVKPIIINNDNTNVTILYENSILGNGNIISGFYIEQ